MDEPFTHASLPIAASILMCLIAAPVAADATPDPREAFAAERTEPLVESCPIDAAAFRETLASYLYAVDAVGVQCPVPPAS